ncbi:hypothetical protein C7B82_27870 [Stenomitos frigidus ULC18]|uniref:Uncharacterized protein n=1 Tax=Stenomitos frigidus ULC18 TaxID=2107698 RepID=A0A2T1DUN5_9CYAN|nr:hypothetical protein C7B82_27870 [Stenomitos frigidus ULC18]
MRQAHNDRCSVLQARTVGYRGVLDLLFQPFSKKPDKGSGLILTDKQPGSETVPLALPLIVEAYFQ